MTPSQPHKPLNVLIATVGSHGDVHPFIGIAQRMLQRGHRVKLFVSGAFTPLARSAGIDAIEVGTAGEFEKSTQDPDLWDPRKGFKSVIAAVRSGIPLQYQAIAAHAGEPGTVLVISTLSLGARVARDKLRIPTVSVHLSPVCVRSTVAPSRIALMPASPNKPHWFNQLLFEIGDWLVVDPTMAPPINALRQQLGLRPVRKIIRSYVHSPDCTIGLWPAWFARPQADWPASVRLTGFPLYDEQDVSPIPSSVEDFLAGGTAPIVFTPGSAMRFGQNFFNDAIAACATLGRRGLLLSRHREQVPARLPQNMLHCDFAPLGALLPRSAAIVFHGGIGTMAQALRAGTPQLVMPMAHDQHDNADRAAALGVAEFVEAEQFTASTATAALQKLLTSAELAAACQAVARRFIGCDPLDQTARLIEQTATIIPRFSSSRCAD